MGVYPICERLFLDSLVLSCHVDQRREGEERGKERRERRRGEREGEERERRQVIKYTNTQRLDVTVSAPTIIKVSFQKICGAESLFMTNHYLNLGFQPNGKSSTSKVFSI